MALARSEFFRSAVSAYTQRKRIQKTSAKTPFLQLEASRVDVQQTVWRRERDSNPRCPLGQSGFQDRLFQPLTHPSAVGVLFHCEDCTRLARGDPAPAATARRRTRRSPLPHSGSPFLDKSAVFLRVFSRAHGVPTCFGEQDTEVARRCPPASAWGCTDCCWSGWAC